MFKSVLRNFYPFFSLLAINIGTWIENLKETFSFLILVLQLVIVLLTIIKIVYDIKKAQFVSIEKSENEVKKKHPIFYHVTKYLKKTKL